MKIEDGRITPLRSVLVLRGLGAGTWPSEALQGIAETFNVLVIDAPDGVTVETFVRPFIRDTTSCDECGLVGEHEADCETGAVAEHTEALS